MAIKNIVKFMGLDKRDSIRKAVGYYHKHHYERDIEIFLAKCRLQKDGKTIHYYPEMVVDMSEYRERLERIKKKENNENKCSTRHRWGFGKLLCWFRKLFK